MKQEKKILITGSTGFLGSHVSEVISALPGVRVLFTHSYSGKRIDITQPFTILPEDVPDCIIHIAGKAHSIPRSAAEKNEFFRVNFEGTKNLCRSICDPTKIRSFVFISTVSVYGLCRGSLIDERTPLAGKTAYARSKIMAEEWLKNWTEQWGIQLVILRLPLLVGKNAPGNFGDMIRFINKERYFHIGQKEAFKSMVLAKDVAKVIPSLFNISGTFHLTDGQHPSIKALSNALANRFNKNTPKTVPVFVAKCLAVVGDLVGPVCPLNSDKLEKIVSSLTFDDAKARQAFGWNPGAVLDNL